MGTKQRKQRDVVRVSGEQLGEAISNIELKRLIESTKTRLENWTVEVERNPNPRMVHVLKNILSHINAFTEITEAKMTVSYKSLSRQMAVLLQEVASLNSVIMDSILDDDYVSASEEEKINDALMKVVRAAVELIRIVQQSFIGQQRRIGYQDPGQLVAGDEPDEEREPG